MQAAKAFLAPANSSGTSSQQEMQTRKVNSVGLENQKQIQAQDRSSIQQTFRKFEPFKHF